MGMTKNMDKDKDVHGNGDRHGHTNKVTNIEMGMVHEHGQF
jgi:hypothetical protein